jgi:hypothetical protein
LPLAFVFAVASDVVCPLLSVFATPTCVPPDGQPSGDTSFGWHRKKVTVPVGVSSPAASVTVAVTVAVSVTAVPGTTAVEFVLACVSNVPGGGGAVVKHSLAAFV